MNLENMMWNETSQTPTFIKPVISWIPNAREGQHMEARMSVGLGGSVDRRSNGYSYEFYFFQVTQMFQS